MSESASYGSHSRLPSTKIPAKDVTWRMGYRATSGYVEIGGSTQNTVAAPHYVKLTSDYYIGVYPVTQAQWTRLGGTNTSTHKVACADCAETADDVAAALGWTDGDRIRWPKPHQW